MEANLSEKELLILESAIKIFSEKGFNGSTTSQIAKEACVAEGTIFRYFKTKKDILHVLIVRGLEILAPKMVVKSLENFIEKNKHLNEKTLIKEIIKERLCLINKNFPLMKVVLSEALISEEIRSLWINKIILSSLPLVNDIIQRGINNGTFKNINATIIIRSFVGSIMTFVAHKNLASQYISLGTDEEEIDAILDIFFNGISSRRDLNEN